MYPSRLHPAEFRQLYTLLNLALADSELMDDLSIVQREQLKGAADALRSLFAVVERREMEDSFNEG